VACALAKSARPIPKSPVPRRIRAKRDGTNDLRKSCHSPPTSAILVEFIPETLFRARRPSRHPSSAGSEPSPVQDPSYPARTVPRTPYTTPCSLMKPLTAGPHPAPRQQSVQQDLARFGPTTPKQFGAKHQTCPHLAAHVRPNSTLEIGAAALGAAIRSAVVGGSPRVTKTAGPLRFIREPWSPPCSCF
jgi:hypothetical protein